MLVCRICLRPTEKSYRIYSSEEGLQIGEIIKLCVPEVDLAISKFPVLCHPCMKLLNASYFFRKLCLYTENCIGEYIRAGFRKGSNYVKLASVLRALFEDEGVPPCPYKNLECPAHPEDSLLKFNDDNIQAKVGDLDHENFDYNLGQPSPGVGTFGEVQKVPGDTQTVPPLTTTSVSSSAGISVKIKSVEMINETGILDVESDKATPQKDECAYKIGSSFCSQNADVEVLAGPSGSSTLPKSPPPLVMIEQTATDPLAICSVSQTAADPLGSCPSLRISDEVVVLDDDDDDVQVIEPPKSADPLNTLLQSTPAIENNDVPELVTITRVDPLNQSTDPTSRPPRRHTLDMPRTVPDVGTGCKDNEPKPIKVVNPKTNQVQIIGYVLSPGSKDRPVITNSRSNSRYTVQKVQVTRPETNKSASTVVSVPENKPSVSMVPDIVVPPLTVVTRSATRAKGPTRSEVPNSKPVSVRDNFFSGLKLKQTDSPVADPFEEEEQEDDPFTEDPDDPDYVSLPDIQRMRGKEIEEVIVKEEAVEDDGADSRHTHGAKRERTDDSEESSQGCAPAPKSKKAKTQVLVHKSFNANADEKLRLLPVVQLQQLSDPLNIPVKVEITEDDTHADSLESAVDTYKSLATGQTSGQDTNTAHSQSADKEAAVEVPDFVEIAGRDGEEAQDGTLPAKRQRRPPQRLQLESADESSEDSGPKRQKKRGRPRKNPVPQPSEEGGVTKRRGRRKKSEAPDPTVMVTEIMKQAGLYHFLSGDDGTEQRKRGKKQKDAVQPAAGEGVGLFHSLFGDIAGMHTESSDNVDVNATYEQDTSMCTSGNFENDSSLYGEASGECLEVTAELEEADAEHETADSTTEAVAIFNESENQNSNQSEEANPLENSVEETTDSTWNQNRPEPVQGSPVPSASESVSNDQSDQVCDSTSNQNSMDQNDVFKDNVQAVRTVNSTVSESELCDPSFESTSNSAPSVHQNSNKALGDMDVSNVIKDLVGDNIEIMEEEDEPDFVDPSAC